MRIKNRLRWSTLALGLCLSAAPIQAETKQKSPGPMQQEFKKIQNSCKSDIDNLCSDVTPGEGRIAACLESKQDQLSSGCKKTWSEAKAKISRQIDKANVDFRKSCGSDVQKYCSEVPSGRGRILSCLGEHQDELSDSCKNFQARLEQKLSAIG